MSFSAKALAGTLALALAGIAAANLAVQKLSAHSVSRQALRKVSQPPAVEVLAVGNSVVAAGFDEAAFAQGTGNPRLGVRNGGLGATGPLQHLLLTRAALASQPHPRLIVYGIVGTLLTDPPSTRWWRVFGNNALVFQTQREVSARHLTTGTLDRLAFHFASRIPWFVERGTLWAKVETLRRRIGGWGLPVEESNQFGRVSDFAQKPAASQGPPPATLTPEVRELLGFARERGIEVWVVFMPMPEGSINPASPAWQPYVDHLRSQTDALGCRFINATDWVHDRSRFIDDLHLGRDGAVEFSERLGRLWAESRR